MFHSIVLGRNSQDKTHCVFANFPLSYILLYPHSSWLGTIRLELIDLEDGLNLEVCR